MDKTVLKKYQIKFETKGFGRNKIGIVAQKKPTLLNYLLSSFFIGNDVGLLKSHLLSEIDKCLEGEEYDGEWIGNIVDLQFNASTATLSDESTVEDGQLPLEDFREIVALWCEWVEKNKLEQKIL